MVAGIKGTCRMSMILAFKIGFLVCTLSWSSLETIFSFMEMRSVIWGGRGGFGRTDTSHFFLLLKSPSLPTATAAAFATAATAATGGGPATSAATGGATPTPPFPIPLVQRESAWMPKFCLTLPWPPPPGISYSLITLMPCSPQLVHDTSDGVGNPWGGKSFENPLTNPGFLETQISAKSQGLKTSWQFFAKFLSFRKLV